MMSCERNSTASFAVDSLAGSCVNVAHCLLRTAYLEILVEEDSRGSIGDLVPLCDFPHYGTGLI